MKVERIYRLFRLVTLLQSGHHYTAAELAEALEVSRRTVFRDLKALELARVPYYFDTDAGTYRLGEGFFLPAVTLTLPEALAVLALAGRCIILMKASNLRGNNYGNPSTEDDC